MDKKEKLLQKLNEAFEKYKSAKAELYKHLSDSDNVFSEKHSQLEIDLARLRSKMTRIRVRYETRLLADDWIYTILSEDLRKLHMQMHEQMQRVYKENNHNLEKYT